MVLHLYSYPGLEILGMDLLLFSSQFEPSVQPFSCFLTFYTWETLHIAHQPINLLVQNLSLVFADWALAFSVVLAS